MIRYTTGNIVARFCQTASKVVSLTLENDRKVAKISLTNPKKRNTLSLQAIGLIKSSLEQVEANIAIKKTKILIFEGLGPVFCSGHDLKQLGASKNPQQIFNASTEIMLKIKHLSVPTLCVINGVAAAAGLQMALACDLIVATNKSTFSTPGVKWGLFCSTPAVQLVRSISSEKKANQMLLFGESITAQQAFQYGLLNRVVPEEDKLNQTVDEFIQKVNRLSGEVIALGKSVLRSQSKQTLQTAYCIAGKGMHANITQKQDCKQGLRAFSQKRHPHYKN